jgi:genome maintenance exonuclease 1
MIHKINYNIPKIERVDSPSGRRYATPEGNLYPSVTTILSTYGDKSYLNEWRDAVGHEVADKITKDSADRGTLLHDNCERYLEGKPLTFDMFQQSQKEMFNYFLPVLNSIEEIHAMETYLWSDRLRCAGAVDLIAVREGELRVIDWKNSRRYKSKEDIPTYFMQMAAYAYMFWERTGVLVKTIEVVIAVEDYGLLTYKEPLKEHLEKFIEHRKTYD